MIRLTEISKTYGLQGGQIMERAKILGIETVKTPQKRWFYEKDIPKIVNFQFPKAKKKPKRYTPEERTKIKFQVIESFLNDEDNKTDSISEKLNISYYIVSTIINDFLKNKNMLIVESKMNFK